MNALPSRSPDFDAWLADADAPTLTPAEAEAAWQMAAGADPSAAAPPPDPARIDALATMLSETARRDARPPLRLVRRPAAWMAAAAVVLLLLGLGWWFQPITAVAPTGETITAHLPDGSEVELNSGATLRYGRMAPRQVQLTGEAFFDVARDETTPFVIETFNAEVRVLGTSFSVRAWPGDAHAETVVAVVSGLVEVAPKDAAEAAVRLSAGQTSRVAPTASTPTAPEPVQMDEATAWRTGGFVFYDEPLGVLFDAIDHRYGVEIEATPEVRAQVRSFIRHEVTDIEVLVSDICEVAGLRYRPTANGFEVYAE